MLHPAFGASPDRVQLRWQEIGDRLGHTVHAQTQWETLEALAANARAEQPWHEEPARGWCPPEVTIPLSDHLLRTTSTPGEIHYAMWIGFADVRSVVGNAPHFDLPGREYALLTGPIAAFPSVIESPYPRRTGPGLSWPADRSWCVATEVGFRWSYVGGTEECIGALEADDRLEVLRTMPEHRGDIESDREGLR